MTNPPLAWRYRLADGIDRYQWEHSPGAILHPVYELTAEIIASLPPRESPDQVPVLPSLRG